MIAWRESFLGVAVTLGAADALADGCFVWHGGADLTEPSQKAIIAFCDGTETMVLQVKYEGPATDFAWIVPLPAHPDVAAIAPEKSPFAEVSLCTQVREQVLTDGRKGEAEVAVLERKVVGVYDVAVLAAANESALADWLTKNGYAFPKNRADVLKPYIRDRWVYAAMRIDPRALTADNEQQLRRGELQPVRFRFPAKHAVYPLGISSLNAGKTEVLLYLLATQPLAHAGGPTKEGFGLQPLLDPRLMGATDPDYGTYPKVGAAALPLTWAALNLATNTAMHLCKYRVVFAPAEMTGDLWFRPVAPVAFGKLHLEQAGDNLQQQQMALRLLAAHDSRYDRRLRDVERRIQDAWEKQMRADRARHLAEGATSTESVHRVDAARHPDLSRDLVRKLAQDSVPGVRAAVAARADVAALPEVTVALARDPDRDVRLALAFNDQAPVDLRAPILLRDAEPSPKETLGSRSPNPALLTALAGDANCEVRVAVAHNTNTPARALWQLAADPERRVKVAAARNVTAPEALILRVARDPEDYVRGDIAMYLPNHPALPVPVLRELAKDADSGIRGYIARHPNLPGDLLRALAADPEPSVRASIATNPNLPAELLRRFAADANANIRAGVVWNPNCPPDLLRQLAQDDSFPVREALTKKADTPADILVALARTMDPYVLLHLSCRAAVPAEALRVVAKAPDRQVRLSVAGRPDTPADVLRELAKDHDGEVAATARKALRE